MVNISLSRDISLQMRISLLSSLTLWLYILGMLEIYVVLAVTYIIYSSIFVFKNSKDILERKIALFSLGSLLLMVIIFGIIGVSELSTILRF